MRTIFKYPLELTDKQNIKLPYSARITAKPIHAGLDPQGELCVWAECDKDSGKFATVTIYIVGTGNPLPDETSVHIGSVTQGSFVWHVYY